MKKRAKFEMRTPSEVLIVSTNYIPGFKVKEVKGLVWASTVRSRSLIKEIAGALRSLIGGRIPEFTNMVNEARFDVLSQLEENAKKMGANAVIELEMTTSTPFPGTIEVLAFGTAVVLEREKE